MVEPALDGHCCCAVIPRLLLCRCEGLPREAFSMRAGCLLASDDRERSPAWFLGATPGVLRSADAGRCGRLICFLAGRRPRTTAKLCEGYDGSLKKDPGRFYAASGRGPKTHLAVDIKSHLACDRRLKQNFGNVAHSAFRRRGTAARNRKSRHRFPAWHKAASCHV